MNPDARRALLAHYDEARRDLPWRGESDPYRILVSEVMLQQTRVDTVLGYYEPWLARFPDTATLAEADTDEVLKAWEGLGYYRRARNLHATARAVRERPDGTFPGSFLELRELPGIGDYTAGAVASIAFDEVVPAVDGNARRVLSRWFDEAEPSVPWLRERASEQVEPARPGDWNQALMELGATICTPRSPRCAVCPVARWCAARIAGTEAERPKPRRQKPVRTATMLLVVAEREGRVLLVRRPTEGLLGGMWAFPECELLENGAVPEAEIGEVVHGLGMEVVGGPSPLSPVEHRFTHLHVVYLPYVVTVAEASEHEGRAWVTESGSTELGVPVAQRKVLQQLTWEVR